MTNTPSIADEKPIQDWQVWLCADCEVYWAPAEGRSCWCCGRPGRATFQPIHTSQVAPGDGVDRAA